MNIMDHVIAYSFPSTIRGRVYIGVDDDGEPIYTPGLSSTEPLTMMIEKTLSTHVLLHEQLKKQIDGIGGPASSYKFDLSLDGFYDIVGVFLLSFEPLSERIKVQLVYDCFVEVENGRTY